MKARYLVTFGASRRRFYTAYHAAQFCRALSLNRTDYRRTEV
jgi:hypothetical protein